MFRLPTRHVLSHTTRSIPTSLARSSTALSLPPRSSLSYRANRLALPPVQLKRIYSSLSSPSSVVIPEVVEEPPPPKTWVDKMPVGTRPYLYLARVDKPIGSWLLFWPCSWSIILASTMNELPVSTPLFYTALFGLGAVVMRGAGCTINDMWDMRIDKAVARTRLRPLAAGDVNLFQATAFLGLQLSVGLGVLTQLNMYSIYLGASSLLLVGIYPFMKRITYWPQSVLGVAFNWGILLGWSAVAGSVDWAVALPLYVGGSIYTIMYDTIYAHQDKLDDVKVAVKSTALLFGKQTIPIISIMSATFVSLLAYTGLLASCSAPFYAISVLGSAAHLTWQIRTVDLDSRSSCWKTFASNKWLGGLIALGLGTDYWYRVGGGREFLGLEKEEKADSKGRLIEA
ncbi:4-hydroxybenzoate polyprenyl transferase [Phaffia rhodozyma]|uniref:4-hydroxybenzoate polyprenyltransferase, mitochondrial n=1 Tax=Phaffia rhodozyma TaxID=264483 RepID=A0A0F7SEN1_PHARH|nr:4-hydroxybenzoate polyprenyl transferase [Phaffia rhodozyma]